MKEEKAINQLLSLIDDRKSFITKDGDNEIYRDDIEALKIGIDAIKERKWLKLRLDREKDCRYDSPELLKGD